MKVKIVRYVQQVVAGLQYIGYITLGGVRLDYEVIFAVPIPQLDALPEANTLDEVRRVFQLKLKRAGAEIELSDEEFRIFLTLLADFVADSYDRNRRACTALEELQRGTGPSASIGIESDTDFDLSLAACNQLEANKFGCRFVA